MKFSVEHQKWSAAYIKRTKTKSFIHRYICRTIPCDTALISQSLSKSFTDTYACIFYRMVSVNIQIALTLYFQVDTAVYAESCEHMIKETDTRIYLDLSAAIKVNKYLDISFTGLSFYFCCSHVFTSFNIFYVYISWETDN